MLLKLRHLRNVDVLVGTLLLCSLAIAFSIHGFSILSWGKPLELTSKGLLSLGPPRGIRGDDWLVNFTFWRAQITSKPSSPEMNMLIGYGQDMSVSPFVFVRHWSSFFKPHLWGFLINLDTGMSWLWQFLSGGVFLTVFFLLRRCCNNLVPPVLALLFAISILFSSFLQFWSLAPVPALLYGGLGFLAFCGLVESKGRDSFVWTLFFGWSLTALGFVFYPPFQIPVIQLMLLGFLTFSLSKLETIGAHRLLMKCSIGFLSGLFSIVIFGVFLWEKQEVVKILLSTVYPGERLNTGGDLGLIRVLQDSAFPFLAVSDFSRLGGNICEAAGFVNFLPLVTTLLLFTFSRLEKNARLIFLVFGGYLFFICFWWKIGIPTWLAKITGLSMVTSVRASGILGVVNLILICLWFASNKEEKLITKKSVNWVKTIWLGWQLMFCTYLFLLSQDFGGFPWPQKLASLVLMTLITLLGNTIIDVNLRGFARGFAALSVLLTFFFNPIVFGGGESLMKASPLIQEIRDVEKRGPEGAWIAFDNLITGHAPLLAGSRSFSGVYLYPDLKLWKVLDPSGQYNHAWNRYAHVVFELDPAAKTPRISTPQGDVVIVATALDSPVLLQLPFSYVMIPISKADQIPKRLYREEARTRDWILAVRLQKN